MSLMCGGKKREFNTLLAKHVLIKTYSLLWLERFLNVFFFFKPFYIYIINDKGKWYLNVSHPQNTCLWSSNSFPMWHLHYYISEKRVYHHWLTYTPLQYWGYETFCDFLLVTVVQNLSVKTELLVLSVDLISVSGVFSCCGASDSAHIM